MGTFLEKMKTKIILISIAVLIAAFFVSVNFMYTKPSETFIEKTIINNIDVSRLTTGEAERKMAEEWNKNGFKLLFNGESYKIPLDLSYDITDKLEEIKKPSYKEKLRYFFHARNKYTIEMNSEGSEKLLKDISELSICDNTDKEKTTNAYVDLSNWDFRIISEKIGTEIDPEAIEKIVLENVAAGIFEAELVEDEIIKQPTITADSDEIKQQQAYYKKNYNYKITYTVDGQNITLTPKELSKLVSYKDKTSLKKKKIKSFVEKLADEYNEYNQTYNFKTSYGSTVSVYAVTFGRILDQDKEIEYLKGALKNQKDDTHELIWLQDKYENSGANDGIGNSYVEVSISGQHVWLYQNGECLVSSDCVTGQPGHDTPKGVYTILYTTGPMTLRGTNDDGTKYASKVNCFMPFYGDCGLHGSNNWRSRWGGSIYKTNGSHGCINLPDNVAKSIANIVTPGYPIVIY